MAGQTTFEFLFRVLRPLPEVWTAMPSVLLAQYPDQHIGEMPTMYRHSTHVSGLRSYYCEQQAMSIFSTLTPTSRHGSVNAQWIWPRTDKVCIKPATAYR